MINAETSRFIPNQEQTIQKCWQTKVGAASESDFADYDNELLNQHNIAQNEDDQDST